MTQHERECKKNHYKKQNPKARVIPKRSEESTQPNLSLSNFNNANQKNFLLLKLKSQQLQTIPPLRDSFVGMTKPRECV